MKKINACIIGARSLSSGPLMKYLLHHKHVNIAMLISETEENDIYKEHPEFYRLLPKKTEKYDPEKIINKCNVVFLHKPHKVSADLTAELIELALQKGKEVKFIDLSADFRLKDPSLYKKWYDFEHNNPQLLEKAVYGLTEMNREKIKNAILVANPGCYPTASILALAPLLKADLIESAEGVIIDAHSGVSGAGKTPNAKNMAYDVEQNIRPYKIGREHQHIPEMEQELSNILGKPIEVTFSPHVAPLKYGILTSHYVTLKKPYGWGYINTIYDKMYKDEPFIRVWPKNEYPEVRNVEGTNFCDIGIHVDMNSKRCIIISAIDNVIKGASGQAIQNMNVMCGFDEVEGLPFAQVLKKKAARVVSPSLQSPAKNLRKIRTMPNVVGAMKIAG